MENASKALLIAGGVLIALLVLGALLLMFNQLSSYQKSNVNLEKDTQLATFNDQFAQYARNDLKGNDLISLVNKVVDYNKKTSGAGTINYDIKITVSIELGQAFVQKFGVNGTLTAFPSPYTYVIDENSTKVNNAFLKTIETMRSYEEDSSIGRNTMSELSSNYEALKAYYIDHDTTRGKTVKDITGRSIPRVENNISIVEQYREYSELKTATFRCAEGPIYENDQFSKVGFKFIK